MTDETASDRLESHYEGLRKALEPLAARTELDTVAVKRTDLAALLAVLASQSPPTTKGWFCETCKAEVHPETVTNNERHELCGTRLSGSSPPPTDDDRLRAEMRRVATELHKGAPGGVSYAGSLLEKGSRL